MRFLFVLVMTIATIAGCKKNEAKVDDIPPVIDLSIAGAFPVQCSEISTGETFVFKARFTDNLELGSFGVDVHHNFDHHSHSTEVEQCATGVIKAPVNPFLLVKNFAIPEGSKTYEAVVEIPVPANADAGDYHFMIKVTDKQGWQTLRGISIKIVE